MSGWDVHLFDCCALAKVRLYAEYVPDVAQVVPKGRGLLDKTLRVQPFAFAVPEPDLLLVCVIAHDILDVGLVKFVAWPGRGSATMMALS